MTLILCRTTSSCVFYIRNTGCCSLQFRDRVMLCCSNTLGAVVLWFCCVAVCVFLFVVFLA